MGINGAIILNKEKGISSFSAVKRVKNIVGASKAGHTGTLDPMAEGVLVVCLDKHTRLVEYLVSDEKTYEVGMFLGVSTETYDLEGPVTDYIDPMSIDPDNIKNSILSFIGKIDQIPPVYSAIKVDGRKLYDYARKGIDVEIPSRTVEIKDITGIAISDCIYSELNVKRITFKVVCSKGTYIRSLCYDIGKKLNNLGTMSGLVRTANGSFGIEDAHTLSEIQKLADDNCLNKIVINPILFSGLDKIQLDENQSEKYMAGIKFKSTYDEGDYIAVNSEGVSIGICIVDKSGMLKSRKRLI